MLRERIEGKWIDCFAEVFGRCGVRPGDPVAILSETQSREVNVQLAELALQKLDARPFHVVVPSPRLSAPAPVRSTGASDALQRIGPVVTALAKSALAPVVGMNYKDAREDALPWLKRNGDPFQFSVYDGSGRIAMDYGVYGVPETYVIDRHGVIRYKHIGPLTPEVVREKIEPMLKDLARDA